MIRYTYLLYLRKLCSSSDVQPFHCPFFLHGVLQSFSAPCTSPHAESVSESHHHSVSSTDGIQRSSEELYKNWTLRFFFFFACGLIQACNYFKGKSELILRIAWLGDKVSNLYLVTMTCVNHKKQARINSLSSWHGVSDCGLDLCVPRIIVRYVSVCLRWFLPCYRFTL